MMLLAIIYMNSKTKKYKLSIRYASDPGVEIYESKYAYDYRKWLDLVAIEVPSTAADISVITTETYSYKQTEETST